MDVDVMEDVGTEAAPGDLEAISQLCDDAAGLEDEIVLLTDKLSEKQKRLRELTTKQIPEKMSEVGVESITTTSGLKVNVKEDVYASISKDNKEAAHDWLTEHGHDDLIKGEVKAKFGKGDKEKMDALTKDLSQQGYDVGSSETVHPATLKSFVKEQLAKGEKIPFELFGIYHGKIAQIKRG